MTVWEWIDKCAVELERAGLHFGHGTDNALDEAAWLVLHAVGEACDGSFENGGRSVTDPEARAIADLLARRIREKKPLAYLLGEAWFCGLKFKVGEAVLVPRSPIGELILAGFSPWADAAGLERVLDLCTGSACIAIATAHYLPKVHVDAADLSADALAIATENVAAHGLAERVELVQSDLFDGLGGRRYDLIVSNPPYVPEASMSHLPGEYLAEPRMGLVAGDDGLDLVLRILHEAPDYLQEGGVLICEVGESADTLQDTLPDVPFLWIEFEHGGEGVFTISREDLLRARLSVEACLAAR